MVSLWLFTAHSLRIFTKPTSPGGSLHLLGLVTSKEGTKNTMSVLILEDFLYSEHIENF